MFVRVQIAHKRSSCVHTPAHDDDDGDDGDDDDDDMSSNEDPMPGRHGKRYTT